MVVLDAEAMACELRRMALLDEGGDVTVPDADTDVQVDDYTLCALSTFVTERSINFNAMRTQMANLWKPHEGISISDKGGPWTFDQNLLALQALTPGDDITKVPLYEVDFWVHAYGFTAEFYSETVGKALGNALGSFLTYDEYNMYLDKESCMRLRVKLDVRKSLLREKEVKKPSSSIMDATSVLLGLATDVSREGAVEVVDDRKRRKGNDHDEADMEVDTENALKLAINNDSTRPQPGTAKGCTKQLSIT
ncbi:hypothetical protein LINGRAHAP2_LOCUS34694 [Linum grandiflorum]